MKNIDEISYLLDEIEKIFDNDSQRQRHGELNLLSMFKDTDENSHSKILAFLLDPCANHRHKTEYLEKFLYRIYGDTFSGKNLNSVKVYREYGRTGVGRIDILLKHKDFVIIIENKIYAKDEKEQLLRYHGFIEQKGYKEKQIKVLYLTLDGHKPEEQSYKNENKEVVFECISYSVHILSWLKKLTFTSSEYRLRSAIEQYVYALEALTGQLEEDLLMTEDIIDLLQDKDIKNDEYIALFSAIQVCEKLRGLKLIEEKLKEKISNKAVYFLNQEILPLENIKRNGLIGIGFNLSTKFSIIYEITVPATPFRPDAYLGIITHNNEKIKFSEEDVQFFKENEYSIANEPNWYCFYRHTLIINDEEAEKIAHWIYELYDNFKDKAN